ncbi:hypothetical protein [Mycolicibacterium aubagnense]|uniref:Uncharacterized protein n=1 Tax=Mycolicibacterium aubagnense TaxID=319707 RepID=A0ABN5Z1L6_9MYCO|nr:hypothetical protein [Mycolicibacterium aubagnense]BBX87893.1 hypothetical protein MAUB_57660 [Mycolicibacterium aubagnense]
MARYAYKGQTYSPGDLIEQLIREGEASPGARGMSAEDVLGQIAAVNGIDRDAVDSTSFPQRIG